MNRFVKLLSFNNTHNFKESREAIVSILKDVDPPTDKYFVGGSFAMYCVGIESKFNDIDIFVYDKETYYYFINNFSKIYCDYSYNNNSTPARITDFRYSPSNKSFSDFYFPAISFILLDKPSVDSILDMFDIDICKVAILSNGSAYSNIPYKYSTNSIYDFSVNSAAANHKTFDRVFKYINKGFNFKGDVSTILDIALKCGIDEATKTKYNELYDIDDTILGSIKINEYYILRSFIKYNLWDSKAYIFNSSFIKLFDNFTLTPENCEDYYRLYKDSNIVTDNTFWPKKSYLDDTDSAADNRTLSPEIQLIRHFVGHVKIKDLETVATKYPEIII